MNSPVFTYYKLFSGRCGRSVVSHVGGLGNSVRVKSSDNSLVVSNAAKNDSSIRLTAGAGNHDVAIATDEASDALCPSEEEEAGCRKHTSLINAYEGTSFGVLTRISAGDIDHRVRIYVSNHTGAKICDYKTDHKKQYSNRSANYVKVKVLTENALERFGNLRYVNDLKKIVNEHNSPSPEAKECGELTPKASLNCNNRILRVDSSTYSIISFRHSNLLKISYCKYFTTRARKCQEFFLKIVIFSRSEKYYMQNEKNMFFLLIFKSQ